MGSFVDANKSPKMKESIIKNKGDTTTKLPNLTNGFALINNTTDNFDEIKLHSQKKEEYFYYFILLAHKYSIAQLVLSKILIGKSK
jgi:hypothetical protein